MSSLEAAIMNTGSTCRAFTLLEILVVVAIIALLITILLPALASARDQAQSVVCKTNMRTLWLGHAMYAADSKNCFPHHDWWLWDGRRQMPLTNWFPTLYAKTGGRRPADSSM